MPPIKILPKHEKEALLQAAVKFYRESTKATIKGTAEKYGIAYLTMRGRLQGAVSRVSGHQRMQVLTPYEESSVVRWYERLDEWAHPAKMSVVKEMVQAIVSRRVNHHVLGKRWISRFLSHHPQLSGKLSTRIDSQRALASDPRVLMDYFNKVRPPFILLLLQY